MKLSIGRVDYFSIILVTVTVTIVVWIFPLILGKYADLTYPYIPANKILSEVITIDEINKKFNISDNKNTLPLCPLVSPDLKGLQLEVDLQDRFSDEYIESFAKKMLIKHGGVWQSSHCVARHAATIIVGIRNRTEQLHQFLPFMHSFLSRQLLRYRIIVVEQDNNKLYNRGKIFNIGYAESRKFLDTQGEEHCLIFHDVDLLPLHDHNSYACTKQPRHMSVAVDTFRYQLPYRSLCGGVLGMQTSQFEAINGFSNKFVGWGGEDDDICSRIQEEGLDLVRFDPRIAMYTMLPHKPSEIPPTSRFSTMQEAAIYANSDGIKNMFYKVNNKGSEDHPLMYHIRVDW